MRGVLVYKNNKKHGILQMRVGAVLLGIFFILCLLMFYFANVIIIIMRFHSKKNTLLLNMIIATEVLFVVPVVPQIMACIILFSPQFRNEWASLIAYDSYAANGLFMILIVKLFIFTIFWAIVLRYKVLNTTGSSSQRTGGSSPKDLHKPL